MDDTAYVFAMVTVLRILMYTSTSCSSALLNAGHRISRSHACAGSLKTTATYTDIHDIFRSWVKTHPVRMDKVAENSPTRVLLSKEARCVTLRYWANFF